MKTLLFAVALFPAMALADAVPMPPDNCPPGSTGRTGHAGTWCEASTCTPDVTCDEGTCREVGLCVDVQTWPCGGRRPDTAEPCTFVVNEALGTCDGPEDCDRGTCVVADRCARAGVFGTSGCGCASVPANRWALGVGLLLGVGLVVARRARSSRRPY